MTFSEAKKEAARKACLRHPDKLMVVDMLEGGYEIGCVSCKREGTTPQIARRPGRVAERLGEMVRDREIAVREGQYQELVPTAPVREQEPLTIEVFQERIKLVKAVVAEMEESVHYGIIPGTSDKSLWEPGAEYLRMAFGITWNYEMLMEHEDYETSDFHYKVRAFALSPDGAEVASWTASAWSKERKFWCSKDCPRDCAQNHAPKGMERGMLPHNTRDRAIKRGFVALIRNVTGTTGYFKQALDSPANPSESTGDAQGTGYPPTIKCPENGEVMRLRDGKFGPYYSHKHGKEWHNIDADKAPQQAQDVPKTDAEGPSGPPAGVDDSMARAVALSAAPVLSFEQKTKMLFDWAAVKYEITEQQVAGAAGITLDQITEATDLKWVAQQVEAIYGGKRAP